jgi:hypothetical protein
MRKNFVLSHNFANFALQIKEKDYRLNAKKYGRKNGSERIGTGRGSLLG